MGHQIAVGCRNGQVVLLDESAESLAFSPNGKLLAVGHGNGKITVRSVTHGEKVAVISGHTKAVLGVAFHPDGVYRNLTHTWL